MYKFMDHMLKILTLTFYYIADMKLLCLPLNFAASSKMLSLPISSQPSTSRSAESASTGDNAGPSNLDFDDELVMRSRSLSATLQKLYLWEKKLCNEVKVCHNLLILIV